MLLHYVVNLMFFTTHLARNIIKGPAIVSGVVFIPNILRKCTALIYISVSPIDYLDFAKSCSFWIHTYITTIMYLST